MPLRPTAREAADPSVAFQLVRRVAPAPAGPYDGGYDTRRGYEQPAVVVESPAELHAVMFGRRRDRRRA
jgi:hypothetical protein